MKNCTCMIQFMIPVFGCTPTVQPTAYCIYSVYRNNLSQTVPNYIQYYDDGAPQYYRWVSYCTFIFAYCTVWHCNTVLYDMVLLSSWYCTVLYKCTCVLLWRVTRTHYCTVFCKLIFYIIIIVYFLSARCTTTTSWFHKTCHDHSIMADEDFSSMKLQLHNSILELRYWYSISSISDTVLYCMHVCVVIYVIPEIQLSRNNAGVVTS